MGAFILERLEDEAAARGLNYIYDVVPGAASRRRVDAELALYHGFHWASRGSAPPPGRRPEARAEARRAVLDHGSLPLPCESAS